MGDVSATLPVICADYSESELEERPEQETSENAAAAAAINQEEPEENQSIFNDSLNAHQKNANNSKNEHSMDLENSDEDVTNNLSNEANNSQMKEDETETGSNLYENYKAEFEKLQIVERNLKEQLAAAQHLAERYQTELSGERLYRKEMEAKTSTLCADTEREVRTALETGEACEASVKAVDLRCAKLVADQEDIIHRLKDRIMAMNDELIKNNAKYSHLLGAYRKCADEMQAQTIELPQDVDQLQFLCLQLREEIIETRAAKEHTETMLKDEVTMLQVQRREDHMERQRVIKDFTDQLNSVSKELGMARSQLTTMQDTCAKAEEMENRMMDYQKVIEDLEKQVDSMQKERVDQDQTVANCKLKCKTLQEQFDTSVLVQKDFVKLSQNLQIELEKIRQAEQEVRWQFDEDAHACNHCAMQFSKNRTRLHCLHCGKIFCPKCLSATVPSGPHLRPAPVCQVCHTLLSRDTAPFFSQDATESSS